MTGLKDNAVAENKFPAAALRAKGEFVRGVSGFCGTLGSGGFPQCQADIIFMLPLIALGAIELLWLKISLVCKRVFQWMWYFQTEPKSMTQKG